MTQILSYGGGMQTVAMCVLVANGTLPKPDYAIAADTGREMPTTWQYARTHIAPHDLATVDLFAHNGDMLTPMHTSTGRLPTFCSTEWKARVVTRYARRVLDVVDQLVYWIGFSLDEKRRARPMDDRRYPLLDLNLTRRDCELIIERAGLPLPSKSRCWMCPHQTDAEWREVQADPDLWQQAIAVDEELRDADERGAVWLHQSRKPLREVELSMREDRHTLQCGLGMCFV